MIVTKHLPLNPAHLNGIPIIHLHGGETTEGALDDKLRHAITQLSTYHFVSAELHYDRVIAMGHSTTNVFNVGPMVIDELISYKPISRLDFQNLTGYVFGESNL